MKRIGPVFAVLLTALAARGGEVPDAKTAPPKWLTAIQKQHREAEAAYDRAVRELPDTAEGNKKAGELWKKYDHKQSARFLAVLAQAKADPKSADALAALEWMLTITRSYYLPAGKPAMDLVREHHAANPRVGKIVAWIGYYTPGEAAASHASALALIQAVADKNPDRTARGQAVMALAWQADRKFAAAEYKQSPQTDQRAAEAEKAYEAVLADYADCPLLIVKQEKRPTLGERARQELFELRHLRVGKTAADIEGEDLDGVKFKLSDYRGKVVVLDFWGDW